MRTFLLLLVLVAASVLALGAHPDHPAVAEGGLVTLYHRDPISCRLGFTSGTFGGMFQDDMLKNAQSDLDFGHYEKGAFTVGIEGGRSGVIVDLGSQEALQEHYGYAETVGGGQGFASIRFEDGRLVILDDYEQQTTQPLARVDALFTESKKKSSSAPVAEDHVYLVRIRDRNDPSLDFFVKLLVVSHVPGDSVTLRWLPIAPPVAR